MNDNKVILHQIGLELRAFFFAELFSKLTEEDQNQVIALIEALLSHG